MDTNTTERPLPAEMRLTEAEGAELAEIANDLQKLSAKATRGISALSEAVIDLGYYVGCLERITEGKGSDDGN